MLKTILISLILTVLFLSSCTGASPTTVPDSTGDVSSLARSTATSALTETPAPAASPITAPTATTATTATTAPVNLTEFHTDWMRVLMQAAFLGDITDALAMLPNEGGEEILETATKALAEKGTPGKDGLTLDGNLFAGVSTPTSGQVYTGKALWNYTSGNMCSESQIEYRDGQWVVTDWSWSPCQPTGDVTPTPSS